MQTTPTLTPAEVADIIRALPGGPFNGYVREKATYHFSAALAERADPASHDFDRLAFDRACTRKD